LLWAFFAAALTAQEYRATLTGKVVDPSGAAVPQATVVAIKSDTNSRFETRSTADGFYTIPQLPPGTYELDAEAPGFKRYVQSGITLGTNERIGQDVHLDIGSSTQSVVVQADAALVQTETASAGQVITSREVENLPVNGRSPMALAYLGFGVISNESPRSGTPV
jgi:Carboxypeptidase regulatory-like domain